jgi:hypothetical protein
VNPARLSTLLALLVIGLGSLSAQTVRQAGAPRAAPTAPLVSAARAAALKRFGCGAPQVGDTASKWRAVPGSFRAPGSGDLVVVCARARSVLVVFWGTSNTIGDTLLSGQVGARQDIFRANRDYITQHLAWYGSEAPEDHKCGAGSITHDGVGVIVGECCSSVYYRRGTTWVECPGAD